METRILCYHIENDYNKIKDTIKKNGGFICAVIKIPLRNKFGDIVTNQFAVIYQSKEEIDVEVKC